MYARRLAKSTGNTLDVKVCEDASFWLAWFDGCAVPNPGRMGLGALLIDPAGERHLLSDSCPHSGCNNEAELLALCALMELALAHGATHLKVAGDSDVAIRYVRGEARTSVARLQPLLARATTLIGRFEVADLCWVPSHRNAEADLLSRQAVGLPARAPVRKKPARRR